MQMKLSQLRPNPFRNLARYPISRPKVETLKASIRSTGFWDNMIVRRAMKFEVDGAKSCYELAYGHHRLVALRELVAEQLIDWDFNLELPVRILNDATMVRIMAADVLVDLSTPKIVDSTIEAVQTFIAKETRTPSDEITASDISVFIGPVCKERVVQASLKRLRSAAIQERECV